MNDRTRLTRRQLVQGGLGAVAMVAGAPLLAAGPTPTQTEGPFFPKKDQADKDLDMTRVEGRSEAAFGEVIEISGQVLDETGAPIAGALVDVWQANSHGRYDHESDPNPAPLDPNFGGCGRTLTAPDGSYEFLTIRPGAYPWPNHVNSWRPMHIHWSVFGSGFGQRLITQNYFEGDPLIPLCPIVNTIGQQAAIDVLVAPLDMNRAMPMNCLAYKFDIVLRGRRQSFFENRKEGL